jgi:3-hydroxybutyrate dehydrogenase
MQDVAREHTAALALRPRLAGKSAIVTGSTSGIGLGIAEALATAGAQVMLNGFGDAATLEAARGRVERAGAMRVAYSPADMSRPTEIVAMIEMAAELFGQVDILVNNAGIFAGAPIETTSPEKWDAQLAINLSSAFHAIRACLGGMKERGFGRIVNIASALGLVGAPYLSAYAASKHGVVGLTKAVALEAAQHGVTVNTICPGYVLTPLIEREIRETAKARGVGEDQVAREFLRHSQPTGRYVTTGQIGALVVFLCSPAAASITAAAISIDGGWTAQ